MLSYDTDERKKEGVGGKGQIRCKERKIYHFSFLVLFLYSFITKFIMETPKMILGERGGGLKWH